MKSLFLSFLFVTTLAFSARADTVCVILSPDTTTVVSVQPPCNGNSTPIDTTDPRWAAYLNNEFLKKHKASAEAARQGALSGGITLTCTGSQTSNLSGTYAIDQDFLNYLMDMMAGNFPSSYVTGKPVIDTSNVLHTFSNPAAFQTYYQIVAGYWIDLKVYYMQVQAGQTPSLPGNTSSAC